MARDEEKEKLKKTILLLQDEIERLSSPPYITGTILDFADKNARISVDGVGVFEVPFGDKLKEEYKTGARVIINPMTKSVVGQSEFDIASGRVVTVEEVDGKNLRVQNRGESCFVLSNLEGVKVGDEVMLDPSGAIALKHWGKKKTPYVLEKIPEAPWSNIGGLEGIIGIVKEEIEDPIKHKEVFERYGRNPVKGVLLYGPPGCGKTMIAKSIAYNLSQLTSCPGKKDGHFIKVNGPEILDKWLGNSEGKIRRIFTAARDTASENGAPVVVFIDEADSILKTRGTGVSTDIYDSIVPQFLAELDGINGNGNVITVLASNREDIIDPAILRDGRVDRRIFVPRPSEEGAAEIFMIYLKNKPLDCRSFGKKDIKGIAEESSAQIYDGRNVAYRVVSPKGTLGFFLYSNLASGAMIKGIVDRASMYAIKREIAGNGRGISKDDIKRAIEEEFSDHDGFAQAIVPTDWEDVFGHNGRQYNRACQQGYLTLENIFSRIEDSTKLKEVKE